MKISVKTWHYRFMIWAWDPYHLGRLPKDLCTYFDKLVLGLVFSWWILIWRKANDLGKAIMIIEPVAIAASVFVFVATRAIYFSIYIAHIGLYGLAGVLAGLVVLQANIEDWKRKRPPTPHEPSVLKEWVKAKHRKICPLLEFE